MPPLLSIVLPVHGVERFLPQCLDSLRADGAAPGEVELIAVDDRSPDGCGALLDAHAAGDPRMRVLHLTENRGLGGARTAGLAEATGTYVWFVDSDDWLPEGSIDAVLGELRAETARELPADVLLTDFTHVYPDGGREPNPWRKVLAGSPLVSGCTAAEHPALFNAVLAVWNKVMRREYLLGLDVHFGRGHYEDISVTYPLLLAADRLLYLDRPCYNYRRGRPGAITATASPKHADAFAQYDAIFAFLDRNERADALRTLVFDRTVKQALTVYDTPAWCPPSCAPSSSPGSPATSPGTARLATATRPACAASSTGWPPAAPGAPTPSCAAAAGCPARSSAAPGRWRPG
ncbi:glycosyltransferase family 2 protein [Kitasatospora fiedleri]|uniref:glycosyltransferase family 2 protein n=1 Tax=Kitasatospora fiedleri TaxID=2991545 RepID=UPI00249B663A|nr:glycosyltransferase [Kitasatospora fiedleri]